MEDERALEIERAQVSDAAAILALQHLAYQREAQLYGDPSLPPLREALADLEAAFATHVILKATIAGRIVGSVRAVCANSACHIARLMVHPQWQGQGIGGELMRQIETHFPDARRFELFTGARSEGNIRLYQRLGYAIVGTETVNDRVSIVLMAKPG